MTPTNTRGATHRYAAPENWDADSHGECSDLMVRVDLIGARGTIVNTSTWKPSADELAHLNAGGVVELAILTQTQPVVSMAVVNPVVPGEHAVGGYDEHGPATP